MKKYKAVIYDIDGTVLNTLNMNMYPLMRIIKEDLNEREQIILQFLYKEELTLTEISSILGISTSRVSQIHSKCLLRLRKILLSK